MSVNVKLGKNTINGVNVVRLEDATTSGTYHNFNLATSGMYKVTCYVDNDVYTTIEVEQGKSIDNITSPTKNGYAFVGWSTTSGGNKDITFPLTPSSDVSIYAVFTTWKCTVAGLGSSSPSNVTFTHSGTMPTFEEVTLNGDTFIKFPTMYRKIVSDNSGQITSFIISTMKEDNTYYPYPCFIKEDGTSVMPYILVGKWMSSSSSEMNSNGVVGQTSGKQSQTIDNGRTNARAKGTGYQLYDWQINKLWQDLLICKMNTINTNSGSGITTDALGIEWENLGGWIDGITHNGSSKTYIFSYKPSKYVNEATVSTDGYQSCGYTYGGTSGQEISKLGYNATHPFVNYPTGTVNNSSYNTYYCDAFSFGTSGTTPVNSRVGVAGADFGAFGCNAGSVWASTFGVRLCYRPISE